MSARRMHRIAVMLSGVASPFLLPMPVTAQSVPPPAAEAPPPAAQTTPTPGDDAAGARQQESEVVVTGSRIVTNGNNSATTVAIVTADQLLTTTPTNVPDGLRKLPQFAGSTSQSTTQAGGTQQFSGSSFLNLRSTGPVRNLVLFDGNRLVPSAGNGAVDVNTIPQLLLQRVDVVTGGVSAVYGSDAVSGVVNFVVDKKFSGLKGIAQAGVSERGDDASQRVGIAGGTSFASGRGHVEFSAEYFNSDGIDSNKDRPNGDARYVLTGAGTAANPFVVTADGRLGATYTFGGRVVSTQNAAGATFASPFTDTNFSQDGVLTPFQHGTATGSPGIESGGQGGYYESSLLATLRTKQFYGRLDYELAPSVNLHTQGTYTDVRSTGVYIQPIVGGAGGLTTKISATNAFLSPALQSQLAAAGVSTFIVRKFQENVPRVVQDTDTRSFFVNAGLDGKIASKVDWSIDYAHSEARRDDIVRGNGNTGRLWAALDAVVAPSGYTGSDYLTNASGQRVVCNVALTNPGLYPGCLPLNIFGPTAEDPRAEAFTRGDTRAVLTQKLDTVSATVRGALFRLPAGEVRAALNGEYRKQTLLGTTNSPPTALTDCTGLRFNCSTALPVAAYRQNVTAAAQGSVEVKEAAGELLIPVFADAFFAKALNVSGAVRYTDYSSSGGVVTWKAGIDWQVTDDLTLRATRSRDIRAPTVLELFGPQQISRLGYNDLSSGINDTVQFVQGSNPALIPEKANTYTIGGVYKPHWLPGFSVAVDYFNIKLTQAITLLDGSSVNVQRQCINSGYTSAVCALYTRTSPSAYPSVVRASYINAASEETHGVDLDLIYRAPLAGGTLMLRGVGTYQPSYTRRASPTDPILDYAGVDGLPRYRVTGFLGYAIGPIALDTQTTWHSETRHAADTSIVYAYANSPAKAFTDLTLTVDIARSGQRRPQFFVNVTNLFDTAPAIAPAPAGTPGFGPITVNGEDPVGRYFTAGFRIRL